MRGRFLSLFTIAPLIASCFQPIENISRSPNALTPPSHINNIQTLKAKFHRPSQIHFPKTNPFTEAKYQLGKTLFFDPRLSSNQTISCASCHNPALSWSDGLLKAVGINQHQLPRKAPTLLNVAWGKTFFWDGRVDSLEAQALGPIQSPHEMNMPIPELIKRVSNIAGYRSLFEAAFPKQKISESLVSQAIATFERTIVSDVAPFDLWIAGSENAISDKAKRGFILFTGKATCVRCHAGWNFTNGQFADIGIPTSDRGRGSILNDSDVDFAFKTPTLRNIARRSPFMHNGAFSSLHEVIENYNQGGKIKRAGSQLFLKPLALSTNEKEDLNHFLQTLTSHDEVVTMPELPKSELKEQP